MQQRKLFIVKGNIQRNVMLVYATVLGAAVAGTMLIVYNRLAGIIEKAAFSAHLSYRSSGELFWDTIVTTNLAMGGLSIGFLLLAIGLTQIYLRKFFRRLKEGIDVLVRGGYAHRLDARGKAIVGSLPDQFNAVGESLLKDQKEASSIIEAALEACADTKEFPANIKPIQEQLKTFHKLH